MLMNLKALQKISYGLYIISSKKGEEFNGQIANTVFQITSQPETAPTYFKDESKKEVAGMQKYKCTVCGYIDGTTRENGNPAFFLWNRICLFFIPQRMFRYFRKKKRHLFSNERREKVLGCPEYTET